MVEVHWLQIHAAGTVMAAGQKFRGVGHMLGAAFVTRPALICRRMGSARSEKEDNKCRS